MAQRTNSRRAQRITRALVLAAVSTVGFSSVAHAQLATWNAPVTGSWTNASRWSNLTVPDNTGGGFYFAMIGADGPAYAVSLATPISLSELTLASSAATLNQSAGTLTVNGMIDIQSGTFIQSGSSVIRGATIRTSGDGTFLVSGSSVLDNVQLQTNVAVGSAATLTSRNGLTLSAGGGISLQATSPFSALLDLSNSATVGGSGAIVFDGAGAGLEQILTNGGTTIFGPGVTIRTGAHGGTIGSSTGAFLSLGTIAAEAAGQSINLLGSWSNGGKIVLSDGTLNLGGTFTTAGLGQIQRTGGNLVLTGAMNNAGATLQYPGIGTLQLLGGTISGGTFSSYVAVHTGAGTLDSVAVDSGDFTVDQGTLNLRNLPSVDDFFATFNNNGTIVFNGSQILSGICTIQFGAGTTNAMYSEVGTLTLGRICNIAGHTANSAMILGQIGSKVVNQGRFGAFDTASLTAVSVINEGWIGAGNGGTVNMTGNWTSAGTIEVFGGTINMGGTINFGATEKLLGTAGTINLTGTAQNNAHIINPIGDLYLRGGTVNGGTIKNSGAGEFIVTTPGLGTLNGVLGDNLNLVIRQTTLNVTNSLFLINNSNISLEDGTLNANGSSLAVGGTVTFNGTTSAQALKSVTIDNGILVRTGTQGGTISSATNYGTISAQTSGTTISLNGTNFGLLEARNGAAASVTATSSNYASSTLTGGTWAVYGGSTLNLTNGGVATNNANVLLDGADSTFAALAPLRANTNSFTITNGRNFSTVGNYANPGTTTIGPSSALTVNGLFLNSGTIDLNHQLIIDYPETSPSPLATLVGQIATGYNGGLWDGPGIHSSTAAADSTKRIGYSEDLLNTSILLELTLGGDANLDGAVDGADLVALAAHWSQPGDWAGGDFNYDNFVNVDDLMILVGNIQQSSPTLTPTAISAMVQSLGLPPVTVPEPATLGLLALAFGGVAFRRQRRCEK